MKITVVDGQGGGIGKEIVERLKSRCADSVHVTALGTNAVATSAMLRAAPTKGPPGECRCFQCGQGRRHCRRHRDNCGKFDARRAYTRYGGGHRRSPALKVLIPVNRCCIQLAG